MYLTKDIVRPYLLHLVDRYSLQDEAEDYVMQKLNIDLDRARSLLRMVGIQFPKTWPSPAPISVDRAIELRALADEV
jgi:hypothetical protein